MLTSNQSNPPEGKLHSFWFRFPQHFIIRQRYSNMVNREVDWSHLVLRFLQFFFLCLFVFCFWFFLNSLHLVRIIFTVGGLSSKDTLADIWGKLSISRVVLCACSNLDLKSCLSKNWYDKAGKSSSDNTD